MRPHRQPVSSSHRPTADPFAAAPLSDSLRALARRGELRRLRRGVQIISEGDRGETLYIILSGRLRAYSASAGGREVTYGTYGAGEYVGEMGLDGGPRSANVEATEATLCAVVTRATLERHLVDHPQFAFDLLNKVIRRARAATMGLKQIALNDVYGRLKALLDGMAQPQPDGSRLIEPAPTHLEMSQRLGCSREMVSRLLKEWEHEDLLRMQRGRVLLLGELPAKW
jgi:CRP/FNR family cyclic AMP-dependent transcriptional regulator